MSTHPAAVLPSPGQPLQVRQRLTPGPGPNDLLIAVESIALNPADVIIRDDATGQFIPPARYQPAPDPNGDNNIDTDKSGDHVILGFDLSGLVIGVGACVPSTAGFQPGKTRIAAYSASFWRSWDPDYGAFQQKCLVPWQHCVILPDDISFCEAASIPVAVCVALNAWEILGLEVSGNYTDSRLDNGVAVGRNHSNTTYDESAQTKDASTEKEAILVWGASSSVGTMGVQTGALLRDQGRVAAVYATAGDDHTEYVRSLGADRVWDYKTDNLFEMINASAKEDGVVIRRIFLAKGDLRLCREVIGLFLPGIHADEVSSCTTPVTENGGAGNGAVPAPVWGRIASAPPIAPERDQDLSAERRQQVEALFVMPSMDEEKRCTQFYSWMGPWLTQALATGRIRPSPEVKPLWRGLGAINEAMEVLNNGVRCCKLVVKIGREDEGSYYDCR